MVCVGHQVATNIMTLTLNPYKGRSNKGKVFVNRKHVSHIIDQVSCIYKERDKMNDE